MDRARVTRIDAGNPGGVLVWVEFPRRAPGLEYGPCEVYTDQSIFVGSQVVVGRISGVGDDLVVLDVRRTGADMQSQVNGLQTQISDVQTRTTVAGMVTAFAGSTAPAGYLLCNGQSVSRLTYAALFDVIGTTYGSGSSTTFNVPNLKGRVPAGFDSGQSEFDSLGETGGAKTHTLTTSEIPSHTHSTLINTNNVYAGAAGSNTYGVDNAGSERTGSTGSGAAHNNLQPYLVLNYIIKT